MGLLCTLTTTLKTMPANTHWHYKKGKEKGVLEITLVHDTGQVILAMQDGRKADWVAGYMNIIKALLT